jgi:putative heme-binding domain-containing protein
LNTLNILVTYSSQSPHTSHRIPFFCQRNYFRYIYDTERHLRSSVFILTITTNNAMKINNSKFFSAFLICLILFIQQGCKTSKKTSVTALAPRMTTPPEKFEENLRTTEFRKPEEERAGFKLPPGFEITLFASEPDISKPINMEFDDKGRLWVTQSSEYPLAAPPYKGQDRITILEDTDGDGKADKITPFAENLNIPIAILPVSDGAIGYSIPNVYHFIDKDGDGKMDEKKLLLGPFGYRDTHGMVSNFVRGFDGWIHSCHGFTNTSVVAGTDGDSISMTSGNTFRFRMDGSRVEQTTFGRVNPFGYAFDDMGYLYSIDCHSKPIYQLIRGGDYPHFGKKASPLGFAPEMMGYELGSTALSGLVWYTGEQYPLEYRNSFYSGDVVSCRINRNTISFEGSTPKAKREEDFVISDDPWFRPVDVKTGPDGSLYIADFYNRIIGHYEVGLDHPGRDRHSGRIWKITYTGNKNKKTFIPVDWSKANINELLKALKTQQLNVRMMVANEIVDRFKDKAVAPVTAMLLSPKTGNRSYVQGLWILYRLEALPGSILAEALHNRDPLIQLHALRILGEMDKISEEQRKMAVEALSNKDPNVQRIAAELIGKIPKPGNIEFVVNCNLHAADGDTHLKYTTLISTRNQLRNKEVMQEAGSRSWNDAQMRVLAKAVLDVPTKEGAMFALKYIQGASVKEDELVTCLQYISRYVPAEQSGIAIDLIKKRFPGDLDVQYTFYNTIRQGISQRGGEVPAALRQWGVDIASGFMNGFTGEMESWNYRPADPSTESVNPWGVVSRSTLRNFPATENSEMKAMFKAIDQDSPAIAAKYISSEAYGLQQTGVLYSEPFDLPSTIRLAVFDNDVHHSELKKGQSHNTVRILLAGNSKVAAEYRLTLDHTSQVRDLMNIVTLDLTAYKGQKGLIEVTDSSKQSVIAISVLEPSFIKMPARGPAEMAQRHMHSAAIAGDYKVSAMEPSLKKLLGAEWADPNSRAAAAEALMTIDPTSNQLRVADVFSRKDESPILREKLALVLAQSSSSSILEVLKRGFLGSSPKLQLAISSVLANSGAGIDYLIEAVRNGSIPAELLANPKIRERMAVNFKEGQEQQLSRLNLGVSSEREAKRQLIEERLASFDPASVSAATGRQMFIQNCSMCHQVRGTGGLIGPQLNGVGSWGQKALTEKILDPNRNISESFRVYNITLKNGKSLTGLYRREEGETMIFANNSGQEFSVAKNDIRDRKVSKFTLMPDYFSTSIAKKDFDALLKYLMTIKEGQ